MISWIQKTFQQHFRVIFSILLAGVIISFVFTIGAAPGIGRAERKSLNRPFFGLNLGSQQDQQKLFDDAGLSVYLQAGFPALEGEQMQQYAFQRQASLSLANQLNIPAPTSAELADHLKTLRVFAGENGEFDVKRYDEFRANLRRNRAMGEGAVSRVLSDDIRVNRVQKLLGGPGYVLPYEVKAQLERLESSWSIGVATADYKAYSPTINPTDAELAAYFEDNAARYEIPPQVRVSYLEFSSLGFVGNVNVSEVEAKAYFDANPSRFAKPDDKPEAKPGEQKPAPDFASVRPQVELALRLERAARLATKAASDFTYALFEKKIAPGTPEFDALLASRNVTLKDVPPFSRDNPPAELGNSPEVAAEAFKLDKEHPFSDAISLNTGSIVLFWKESIAARQPLLAEVRAKVSADYVENEKRKRFVDLGKNLRSQLAARIKAGDSFEKAVAAVSGSSPVKLEAKLYPAFTLRQRPQDLDYLVLGTLESLQKGEVSEMVLGPEKGLLVYAADKKLPEMDEQNPQFKTMRTQLAQFTSSRNSGEYLRELIETELTKSAPARP